MVEEKNKKVKMKSEKLKSYINIFAFFVVVFSFLFFVFHLGEANAQAVTKDIGISVEIVAGSSTPPSIIGGGGGGGGASGYISFQGTGSVVLKGYAYPYALIFILRNNALSATAVAQADGTFVVALTGVPAGFNTLSIFAQDARERQSETLTIVTVVFSDMVSTLSNLFIPPTIEAPRLAQRNAEISIEGYVFPSSEVSLFFEPDIGVRRVTPEGSGAWEYTLFASSYRDGVYTVRARALMETGLQSAFGSKQTFKILAFECRHGDLNGDGEVDMTDLSILLFWWERFHSCPDQNGDGIVDMIDASILFYWWTK